MRFCPWYPLSEAAARVPVGESVLQLRVASGLIEYPEGKSAMVHYSHALDAVAVATALATEHRDRDRELWCRHVDLEGDRGVDLAAFHARLLQEFVRRFGRAPSL